MSRFFLSSLLVVVCLALISQVLGDHGKVTCTGKDKTPNLKLLGTFAKAKCAIPKDGSDEATGSVTRCVFKHLKVFTPPSTFNNGKAESEMAPIFPSKYQAGFKTKIAACIKTHGKAAKSEKDDKSGKSWAPLFKCFGKWYDTVLCQ